MCGRRSNAGAAARTGSHLLDELDDHGEQTCRLATSFDGAEALNNADATIDLKWLETHCPKVVEGIRRIVDFVVA